MRERIKIFALIMIVCSVFVYGGCSTFNEKVNPEDKGEIFAHDDSSGDDGNASEEIDMPNKDFFDNVSVKGSNNIYKTENLDLKEKIYSLNDLGFDKTNNLFYYEYISRDAKRDEKGNALTETKPVLDEHGNVVYKKTAAFKDGALLKDGKGNTIYEDLLDDDGNKIPMVETNTLFSDSVVYRVKSFDIKNKDTKEVFTYRWPYKEEGEFDNNGNEIGSHDYLKNFSSVVLKDTVFVKVFKDLNQNEDEYYVGQTKFDFQGFVEKSNIKINVGLPAGEIIERLYDGRKLLRQIDSGLNSSVWSTEGPGFERDDVPGVVTGEYTGGGGSRELLVSEKQVLNEVNESSNFDNYLILQENIIKGLLGYEYACKSMEYIYSHINEIKSEESVGRTSKAYFLIAKYHVASSIKDSIIANLDKLKDGNSISLFGVNLYNAYVSPEKNKVIIDFNASEPGLLQDQLEKLTEEQVKDYYENFISMDERIVLDLNTNSNSSVLDLPKNSEISNGTFLDNDRFLYNEIVSDSNGKVASSKLKILEISTMSEKLVAELSARENISKIFVGKDAFIVLKDEGFSIFNKSTFKNVCNVRYDQIPMINKNFIKNIDLDSEKLTISQVEEFGQNVDVEAKEAEQTIQFDEKSGFKINEEGLKKSMDKYTKKSNLGIVQYNYKTGVAKKVKNEGVYRFVANFSKGIFAVGIEEPPKNKPLVLSDFYQSSWYVFKD